MSEQNGKQETQETGLVIIPKHEIAQTSLSASDVVAQAKQIHELMSAAMRKDFHYGTIPGCGDKPTLLKPGAEKLNFMFRNVPDDPNVTISDMGNGHREYIVRISLRNIHSGLVVGTGVGSCSTMESKYRWRKKGYSCPACEAEAISRSKYPPKDSLGSQPGWYCRECKAGYAYDDQQIRSQKTGRVENADIADQYNTWLKMAKKRAYVDATLTATAASDVFTQDVEDNPGSTDRDTSAPANHTAQPTRPPKSQHGSTPQPKQNSDLKEYRIAGETVTGEYTEKDCTICGRGGGKRGWRELNTGACYSCCREGRHKKLQEEKTPNDSASDEPPIDSYEVDSMTDEAAAATNNNAPDDLPF